MRMLLGSISDGEIDLHYLGSLISFYFDTVNIDSPRLMAIEAKISVAKGNIW